MHTCHLDGEEIRYRVRSGKSRRNAYIRVGADLGFEVVLPRGRRMDPALLLEEKKEWLKRKLSEHSHLREAWDEGRVFYKGRTYSPEFVSGKKDHVEIFPDSIRVSYVGDPAAALEKWMREEAREYAERKAGEYAGKLGVSYNRISIRDCRSRWGSCSAKKNLSFNYRIMCLPEDVADYLVAHEVAHLKELNHSARYWRIVDDLTPDRRRKEKQLASFLPGMRLIPTSLYDGKQIG